MFNLAGALLSSLAGRIISDRRVLAWAGVPGEGSDAQAGIARFAHGEPGDRPSDGASHNSPGSAPEPLPRRVKRAPEQPAPSAPRPAQGTLAGDLENSNKGRAQEHDVPGAASSRAYLLPLGGGIAALALGWIAESIVRSHNTTPVSLLLYLLAICLFAATDPTARVWAGRGLKIERAPAVAGASESAEQAQPPDRMRKVAAVMALATAGAIVAGAAALWLLQRDLTSVPAVWLWLLSMVVLLAAGIVVSRWQSRPALWGRDVWPRSRTWAWAAVGVIVLIMVVAAATRLIGLDRVPFGINADEGDRAATAIQIIRGQNTQSLFDNGWYWISILYFWLLAQVMKIAGISYVGARVFGAVAGIISVGIVTWVGARNFGLRVGLLAGVLLSVMAASLQFGRETSEAGPTATLWAASVACFLEGARRGRYWAWIGAGLAGGLSIYFYPTGRLWVVLAVPVCGYLLIQGLGGRRREILLGSALAGVASILAVAPFVLRVTLLGNISMLTQRAQETSIFTGENTTRLDYVEPGWNLFQLLTAQVVHSMGIFNQFKGETDFWPYEHPIMPVALSLLTLLGLGWCCLRLRDPRFVILAIWFWVGMVGVIVTVETPNLQRMATAIPVLALFAALTLDSLARRIELLVEWVAGLRRLDTTRNRRVAGGLAGAVVALAAVAIAVGQYQTYFQDYGPTDRWPQPSYLGWAVRDQGTDTWVFTVGPQYHMVNSGWVRLLAPDTPRGGVVSPGTDLPLSLPAQRNMAFLVFPRQAAYLPYLHSLYPGGTEEPHTHPTEGLMFTLYKVPRQEWTSLQGALVQPPTGEAQHVAKLGVLPAGWSTYPARVRWTAELSVPQYGNYAFRVSPGPSRLEIDGREVVNVGEGFDTDQSSVSLARGSHYLVFDATLQSPEQTALVRWAHMPPGDNVNFGALPWVDVPTEQLTPAQGGPHGLYAVVNSEGHPEVHRVDATLASCLPAGQILSGGETTRITWTGSLDAPSTGVYSMTLLVKGPATLKIDDKSVISTDKSLDSPLGAEVALSEGKHPVQVDYSFSSVLPCIEWIWTPPGGQRSIVPPSVLSPPQGAGVSDPLPQEILGKEGQLSLYNPIDTIP